MPDSLLSDGGISIAQTRAHIERKIATATLEEFPFPHLVIEDFFPSEVYQQILAQNPFKHWQGRQWFTEEESRTQKAKTPYYARSQVNFHKGEGSSLPPDIQNFWAQIEEIFISDDWFPRTVIKRYESYFAIRFGKLMNEEDFFEFFEKELFCQRHEPGYYIGPHTDIPTRVFTCIFSFAEFPGFDEYGTQLLTHKDRLVRCWGNDHYEPDDFVVEKVAPYRPNNFLLFFKTRQSFHAVREIDETVPNQRFGMQFQWYEKSGGIFRDLSAPDIMKNRHVQSESLGERVRRRLGSVFK